MYSEYQYDLINCLTSQIRNLAAFNDVH